MGRTIPTFTRYLEEEMSSWKDFRRALCKEDREVFDRLFRYAKKHIAEASCAARPIPFDALVMSVLLEQQKEIERLKNGDSKICVIPVLTSPPSPLSVVRRGGIKGKGETIRALPLYSPLSKTPPLHKVERGLGGEVNDKEGPGVER